MRDDEGRSPLDRALEDLCDDYDADNGGSCVDVGHYLMGRGCACGDKDKTELLCAACMYGKLDVVKELVEKYKVDPKSECDNIIPSSGKFSQFGSKALSRNVGG